MYRRHFTNLLQTQYTNLRRNLIEQLPASNSNNRIIQRSIHSTPKACSVNFNKVTPDGNLVTKDLCTYFFNQRTIFLCGELNVEKSSHITAQMLYLESKPGLITLHLDCSGGSEIGDAMAIHDAMKAIKSSVRVWCYGQVCGTAALILCGTQKENRIAAPRSYIQLLNSPVKVEVNAVDVEEQITHMKHMRELSVTILAEGTGRTEEEAADSLENETYMSAEHAKDYGLIGEIAETILIHPAHIPAREAVQQLTDMTPEEVAEQARQKSPNAPTPGQA